jgi:hypothetical protein
MTGDDNDRHVGLRTDFTKQVQAVLLPEPQVQDHQINVTHGKLMGHLLTAGRNDGPDVIFTKVARDHTLQGWIVLYDENGCWAPASPTARIIRRCLAHVTAPRYAPADIDRGQARSPEGVASAGFALPWPWRRHTGPCASSCLTTSCHRGTDHADSRAPGPGPAPGGAGGVVVP